MHEATRRTLSTLLRRLDGFKERKSTIFVCATNRKEDLDPALLSRFDLSVHFGLPDEQARGLIFSRYARHLDVASLERISQRKNSGGMAGRDIKEICQAAERKWASLLILGETTKTCDEPPFEVYVECARQRKISMQGGGGGGVYDDADFV